MRASGACQHTVHSSPFVTSFTKIGGGGDKIGGGGGGGGVT